MKKKWTKQSAENYVNKSKEKGLKYWSAMDYLKHHKTMSSIIQEMINLKFYNEHISEEKLRQEYLTANSRCKCDMRKKPYTVSGLALYIGLTTKRLREYEKDYPGTEYAEIIERAKQTIETYTAEATFDNKKFQGAKFNLQNNFGWAEKQDTNLSGEVTKIIKLEDVL